MKEVISQATQDSHRLDGKVPFSLRVWAESTGVKSGKAQSSTLGFAGIIEKGR